MNTDLSQSNPCNGATLEFVPVEPVLARRELTLAVTDLLQDMPGPGASQSERSAWLLRKVQLLREIEAVSR
jgi:hypothetical protein